MKRRPLLLAAAIAVLGQVIALYLFNLVYAAVILAAAFEIGFFVYGLTGRTWKYMLLPVIFLTFLLIFYVQVRDIKQIEETADEICAAFEEDGIVGKVARIQKKETSIYIYINDATYVVEKDPGGANIDDAAYLEEKDAGGILLIVEELPEDIFPGCKVMLCGELELIPSATNPGQFDSRDYYLAQGYMFRSFSAKLTLLETGSGLQWWIWHIREFAGDVLKNISDEDDLEVFLAMLLGDRSELDDETTDLFKAGGISHILAISGLHISFIGMFLKNTLKRLGFPVFLTAPICGFFLICYTYGTGNSVSSQRACIMMLLKLGALLLGRSADTLSSMALSWIIISLRYPWQITQAGCQLSFGAILAIGMFLPVLEKNVLEPKKIRAGAVYRFFRGLRRAFLSSATVQLTTLPILAWHFFQLPMYSILINLIALPLSGLLFGSIFLAVAVGSVFTCLGWGLVIPKTLLLPAHFVLVFYNRLCSICTYLPGYLLTTGRPRWWQIAVYATLLSALCLILYLRVRRVDMDIGDDKIDLKPLTGEIKSKLVRQLGYMIFIIILMVGGAAFLIRARYNELTVVFMDVGQGDGIFLMDKSSCILIDGGSSFTSGVGTYRIEPLLLYYGVDHVNAWIFSHPDTDHYSGFIEIMEDESAANTLRVDAVITGAAVKEESKWIELSQVAQDNGISVLYMESGMTLTVGDMSLTCLYPGEEEAFTETNDLSLVLKLEYGEESILFTGDISEDVEELLCERYGSSSTALSCTILKVAHHGSKYSSSSEFLDMTNASYGIISCGNNNYGHPAEETLERLDAAEIEVHITKEEGAIIVTIPHSS